MTATAAATLLTLALLASPVTSARAAGIFTLAGAADRFSECPGFDASGSPFRPRVPATTITHLCAGPGLVSLPSGDPVLGARGKLVRLDGRGIIHHLAGGPTTALSGASSRGPPGGLRRGWSVRAPPWERLGRLRNVAIEHGVEERRLAVEAVIERRAGPRRERRSRRSTWPRIRVRQTVHGPPRSARRGWHLHLSLLRRRLPVGKTYHHVHRAARGPYGRNVRVVHIVGCRRFGRARVDCVRHATDTASGPRDGTWTGFTVRLGHDGRYTCGPIPMQARATATRAFTAAPAGAVGSRHCAQILEGGRGSRAVKRRSRPEAR